MNRTILATGVDGELIFLVLLMLFGIAVGCMFVIVMSFWLTSKVGGSRRLVWGSVLVVLAAHAPQLLGLLSAGWGHWHDGRLRFLIESLLPSAAAAAALACLVNLIIWQRKRRQKQTAGHVTVHDPNSGARGAE